MLRQSEMAQTKLRDILVGNGIKQTDLSRQSGVSAGTINKLVNNRRSVSPTTETKIAKAISTLAGKEIAPSEIFTDI